MYPRGELDALVLRKELLLARIALRRMECVLAAQELAKPIAQVDRGIELWHRISPMVKLLAVPVGMMLTRFLQKRFSGGGFFHPTKIKTLIGLFPMIMQGIRMMMGMRAARAEQQEAEEEMADGMEEEAIGADPESETTG